MRIDRKRRNHFQVALVLLVGMLMPAAWLDGAITPAEQELLELLLKARESTAATSASGQGEAEFQGARVTAANGDGLEKTGPALIRFAYSGKDSIYWQTDAKDGSLTSSTLLTGMKSIRYTALDISGAPHVEIDMRETEWAMLDERLGEWTFAHVNRLPWISPHAPERDAFQLLVDNAALSLHRSESGELRVSASSPVHSPTQMFIAVFDLDHGGVVKDFYYQWSSPEHAELKRDVHIQWELAGDKMVPKQYRVSVEQMRKDKTEIAGKLEIKFMKFTFAPVATEEFAMNQLKIPAGTPVYDNGTRTQYWYGYPETMPIGDMLRPKPGSEASQLMSATTQPASTQPAGAE